MTEDQVVERAEIIFESDAVCAGCGADPRAAEAHKDDDWFIDDIGGEAFVRCPECW